MALNINNNNNNISNLMFGPESFEVFLNQANPMQTIPPHLNPNQFLQEQKKKLEMAIESQKSIAEPKLLKKAYKKVEQYEERIKNGENSFWGDKLNEGYKLYNKMRYDAPLVDAPDWKKVLDYIDNNFHLLNQDPQLLDQGFLYIKSNEKLPRSIVITKDGKFLVRLNKTKAEGDWIAIGASRKCKLAIDVFTRKAFAYKTTINKSKIPQAEKESKFLKLLSGSLYVPQLHHEFKLNDKHHAIIERAEGNLLDLIANNVDPQIKKDIAYSLILGLQDLHEKGILHRDLKAENILIDGQGQPKISDYDLAKLKSEQEPKTFAGSPAYMAPEHGKQILSLKREVSDISEINEKQDIWALGCLIYELVYEVEDFPWTENVNDVLEIFTRLDNYKTDQLLWKDLRLKNNDGLDQIIKGFLRLNPEDRMSLKEAKNLL